MSQRKRVSTEKQPYHLRYWQGFYTTANLLKFRIKYSTTGISPALPLADMAKVIVSIFSTVLDRNSRYTTCTPLR